MRLYFHYKYILEFTLSLYMPSHSHHWCKFVMCICNTQLEVYNKQFTGCATKMPALSKICHSMPVKLFCLVKHRLKIKALMPSSTDKLYCNLYLAGGLDYCTYAAAAAVLCRFSDNEEDPLYCKSSLKQNNSLLKQWLITTFYRYNGYCIYLHIMSREISLLNRPYQKSADSAFWGQNDLSDGGYASWTTWGQRFWLDA